MENYTKEIYKKRRNKIAESMKDNSLLFLFSGQPKQKTTDMDYPFSPDRNYFYMTGLSIPHQILVVSKLDGLAEANLFVSRPDPYLERYHGHMNTAEEYSELTGIKNVFYLDQFDWNMSRLISRNYFNHLYMDYHKRDLDTVVYPENEMTKQILSAHPYLQVHNISREICNLRRIKSEDEIQAIREAIRITGLGIQSIMEHMGEGVKEEQLQAYFEFTLKYHGAMGNAFAPIIASGKNSNVLHYEDNNQMLKAGDVLLLDLGAEYGYYSADISRTFPVSKTFNSLQREYYEAVLYAQKKIEQALKPGLRIDDTLEIARDALFERCKELGLTKNREDMNRYLPHGVCHYMGLDTHDVGDRDILIPGMVITMEPGIYLNDYGFGIRIEDDVLITESGCEVLSEEIPKTIKEVEGFFK